MKIKILALDHVGFNVSDPERSIAFYSGKLGLVPERLEEFRSGRAPFPSVRVSADTIIDFFPPGDHRVVPDGQNVNHIALTFANSPEEIKAFLNDHGVSVVAEMIGNFGARGNTAHAFHVKDPDGNLLELHAYEGDVQEQQNFHAAPRNRSMTSSACAAS